MTQAISRKVATLMPAARAAISSSRVAWSISP
jgi:hypothetical protein